MKYTSFPVQQKKLYQNRIAPTLIQPTQVNYSKYSVTLLAM